MELRKAARAKSKLRVGLSGPSGSGKTYSALLLAKGLTQEWNKIALIDTENGSGELYSHLGDYNVITLTAPFSPERYIEAIKTAEDAGMECIVIDSTSHEWEGKGGCLESNEKLASAKFKGNTWAAWSETTPKHQKFLEAIVTSKCHIITTARSKTDTIQTEDRKIKKVGLKDIQREGFEYELTVMFNIDRENHLSIASKDRTCIFIDRNPFLIGEETGEELLNWTESGIDAPKIPRQREMDTNPTISPAQMIKDLTTRISPESMASKAKHQSFIMQETGLDLIPENYYLIVERLEVLAEKNT